MKVLLAIILLISLSGEGDVKNRTELNKEIRSEQLYRNQNTINRLTNRMTTKDFGKSVEQTISGNVNETTMLFGNFED